MEEASGGHAAASTDLVTRFTAETIAARQRRAGAWVLIALGVGCILFGGIFFAAKHSGHDVVATVTHEGPCANGTCTVGVAYIVAGEPVTAVMYGVNSGEIHGPPWHRLLNITYQPGYETDPATNDMPDAVWIGFGAAGLVFVGWGAWRRPRQKGYQPRHTVAAAGGAPAGAAVAAAMAPAVGGQPGPGGPAGISGRGPTWAGESGAITIATIEPRFMASFFTLTACALAGSWTQDGPQWVRHAPRWAAVTYLVIVAAALVWGCLRGWRIGLRIDEDSLTVRNFFRTHRFSLAEVRLFADGSVFGGESKHWWALCVVLRNGRTVTARGTTRSGPPAPKTLAAIRQAAERHAITAELTGTATKRGSREALANPGLYPDPGGQPGLRHWDGRQWSPFLLRADPAGGKPGGGKAPAEVWVPLAGSAPQWHDAEARVRQAGIVFAAWLGVTAVVVAVTVVLYARDLSKPRADFTLAVVALSAAALALLMTCSAWARRKDLRKIDRAGKAAAGLTDAGGRRESRVRQVAWALVPIVSVTVLAWWPFLMLARTRGRSRDWAVFTAYLAAVVAEIVTFAVAGILPVGSVADDIAGILFYAIVLLVAITAPLYTLMAFRPAGRLPSWPGAEQASAAAKWQQPVINAESLEGWADGHH